MAPIAVHEVAYSVPASPSAVKQAAGATAKGPLPVYPDAVAPDYMYKFKYNHSLPTHGGDSIEIPQDADAVAVVSVIIQGIESALAAEDGQAFADLFLEHGVWRDRIALTWDYRTFNFRPAIAAAAQDLLPTASIRNLALTDPAPKVERPYADLSFIQAHITFDTAQVGASALMNIVLTKDGYKIWTFNSAIESLHGYPEVPERDGHMIGSNAWDVQREIDNELLDVEPEVLIIGGGQNGLMTAARLKALGVTSLVVERNKRIGDNWRGRYEALSLHFPHWADHFPYMPYPEHWPQYTPAAKLADWFEWYVSAMELTVWTDSNVAHVEQDADGAWTVQVDHAGKNRTFHPKRLIMATSLAGVPYSPVIPGSESFQGTLRHSTEHDSSRAWVGKRVLVVGTSSSGFDTAYDFARRGIDVTMLQRSPTYVMSLEHSVPRYLGVYKPQNGKRPDLVISDRIAQGMPVGPGEEMARRLGHELTELDHELLAALEAKGLKTWRGQRHTSTQTLGFTKNGGFYFDAGACKHIINGDIKVEQGWIDRFEGNKTILNGNREREYDLVILATGFSNTVDSLKATLGEKIASQCGPIWGIDEQGELNSAWRQTGIKNFTLMVGTLMLARYHSKIQALRIKAELEGVAGVPYVQ